MAQQLPKKAVQLVAFDQNKNPFIPAQALALLQTLETTSLHVIAVAGKYRTGKSYILNRVLLDRSDGFRVGHTVNACTKGLWAWPELVQLGDKDCLIIDTEGLGSLEEGQSTDIKIFLLALLFSSYLIFNSTGSIDQKAMENLHLVLQLANILQRQDKYDAQQLLNTFPSFLWLLRDFSLKLVDSENNPITLPEYLEQALRNSPKTTPATQRKNQIRKQIRAFFQQRNCFALVRPTQEEKDLHSLNSLAQNKLRPEFVSLVSDLKRLISTEVRPKTVRGRTLSTQGFVELCKYYTRALEDGKLPTLTSHWEHLCLGQTNRIFQKFQLQHIRALQSACPDGIPCLKIHKSILKSGEEAIQKSFLGKLEKQLFKERLERKLQSQFEQIKAKMISQKNRELRQMLSKIEVVSDGATVMQKYQKMMQSMTELSEKSSKEDGVYCQLFLYLSEHSRYLLEVSESSRLQSQAALGKQISALKCTVIDLKNSIADRQRQFEQEITKLKNERLTFGEEKFEEARGRQKQLLVGMQTLKKKVSALNAEISDSEQQRQKAEALYQQLTDRQRRKEDWISKIEQNNKNMKVQLVMKEELIKQLTIKMRKLQRETQIVQKRYEQHLQGNLKLQQQIQCLSSKIVGIQCHNHRKSPDSQLLQVRMQLWQCQQEMRYKARIKDHYEKAFRAVVEGPHQRNTHSLRQTLSAELQQKQSLKDKLYEMSVALQNCSHYTCSICRQNIANQLVLDHSRGCHQPDELVEYDVGFSCEEEVMFQIQIRTKGGQRVVQKGLPEVKMFLSSMENVLQRRGTETQAEEYEEVRSRLFEHLCHFERWSNITPALTDFLQLSQ